MPLYRPMMPWRLRLQIAGMVLRGELALSRQVISAPNGDIEMTLNSRVQHDTV